MPTMPSALDRLCRNVTVDGRRTSLRLERHYWEGLDDICRREGCSLNDLMTEIERRGKADQGEPFCLTSAARVFVLDYFRSAETEAGHASAGHSQGNPVANSILSRPSVQPRRARWNAEDGEQLQVP